MYEPAVAEEEALPEPEAAPAPKGEHVYLSVCFPESFVSNCIGLSPCTAYHICLLTDSSKRVVIASCCPPWVLC